MKLPVLVLTISFAAAHLAAGEKSRAATGAKQNKKSLEVKVEKTKEVVKITARGKSGYHCNTLYPWKLTVEGGSNGSKVYKKGDAKKFSKESVVFEVPHIKGQKAKMKMSVCNDKQCIMHEEKLSW
jgi:hypothetical protein